MTIKQLKADLKRVQNERAQILANVENAMHDACICTETAHLTDTERAELVNDCVQVICDRRNLYGEYKPNYVRDVLYTAHLYGCMNITK